MFSSQQRTTRIVYALTDLALTVLAFGAAYFTRRWLPFQNPLGIPMLPLVLAYCVVTWAAVGHWLGVHRNLETTPFPIIIRNSFRQAAIGAVCLVLFEFILHLRSEPLFSDRLRRV